MTDPQKERFLRAWADSAPQFDKDRGRDHFLAAQRRSRTSRTRRMTVWLAAAATLVGAALVMWLRWSAPLTFTASNGRGEVGAWLATGASSDLSLAFSEGTRVVLERDSRGRVEHIDRGGAQFLLERGAFHADVVHRAGTDWRFRAGPFEVLVTGTSLSAAWDPQTEELTVKVESGSVVVRGPALGDQIVRAGERCSIDSPAKSVRITTGDAAPATSASVEVAPIQPGPSAIAPAPSAGSRLAPPAPSTAPAWSVFEGRGDYDGAYAAAERAGLRGLYASSAADDLLRLAQVGHLSGHGEVESEALLACRRRFPSTPEAGLAAYQLGRASAPAEAVTWFEAYLRELPDGSLAREAEGRLMEAHAFAGNEAAAREQAKRYLTRYPSGPQAPFARRLLAGEKDE